MRENRTSGSMRRGERRSDGPLGGWTPTRKGGNRGAPPDLYATALAPHSTERGVSVTGGWRGGPGGGPQSPSRSRDNDTAAESGNGSSGDRYEVGGGRRTLPPAPAAPSARRERDPFANNAG